MCLKAKVYFNSFDLEPHWTLLPVRHHRSAWEKCNDLSGPILDRYLDILNAFDQRCTFFIVGAYAQKYPDRVQKIVNQGHEIASHSMWHEDMALKGKKEFIEDVAESKKILEDISGQTIFGFRAPAFSIKYHQIPWLSEAGIQYDASTTQSARLYGGDNLGPQSENSLVKVFPFSGHKYMSHEYTLFGGGYLRILPSFLVPYLLNNENFDTVYLHCHDFDGGFKYERNISPLDFAKRKLRLGSLDQKLATIYSNLRFSDYRSQLDAI